MPADLDEDIWHEHSDYRQSGLMPPAVPAGSGAFGPGPTAPRLADGRARMPASCRRTRISGPALKINRYGDLGAHPLAAHADQSGNHLRISARVKAIAATCCGAHRGIRRQCAAQMSAASRRSDPRCLPGHGQVVEVSAIVGRAGGTASTWPGAQSPTFGHFGLDLIGDNNGSIRIESIVIEDVTAAFLPGMLDWVDVRDFGAVGDGVTTTMRRFRRRRPGRRQQTVLVPEGSITSARSSSMSAPMRFVGTLKMPRGTPAALTRSFDYPTYAEPSATRPRAEARSRRCSALPITTFWTWRLRVSI